MRSFESIGPTDYKKHACKRESDQYIDTLNANIESFAHGHEPVGILLERRSNKAMALKKAPVQSGPGPWRWFHHPPCMSPLSSHVLVSCLRWICMFEDFSVTTTFSDFLSLTLAIAVLPLINNMPREETGRENPSQ